VEGCYWLHHTVPTLQVADDGLEANALAGTLGL